MARALTWNELPERLQQLAGRAPLDSGRMRQVIRSSQTLEYGPNGGEPRFLVIAEDELDRLAITTVGHRLLISVPPTTFYVARDDFREAVEETKPREASLEIRFEPDLTLDLQFEYVQDPRSTD